MPSHITKLHFVWTLNGFERHTADWLFINEERWHYVTLCTAIVFLHFKNTLYTHFLLHVCVYALCTISVILIIIIAYVTCEHSNLQLNSIVIASDLDVSNKKMCRHSFSPPCSFKITFICWDLDLDIWLFVFQAYRYVVFSVSHKVWPNSHGYIPSTYQSHWRICCV